MSNHTPPDQRRCRGRDNPTLADVAREAGVSSITVSRVVNAPDSVRESTRKRVEATIERLGYVRNRLAGSLASADSRFIAVIVPSLSNIVFNEVIYGLQTTFEKHGYQILLGNTDYSMQREYELVRTFLGWSPSALVTTGLRHMPVCREMLTRWKKPVMEIMELGQGIDLNVGLSHYAAGRCMAEHLLEKGYRRIVYAGTQMQGNYRARLRYEGQRDLLEANGLEASMAQWEAPSSFELGKRALQHILERFPDTDAIQFTDDMMAAGAVLHAKRQGIDVPADVAIGGFAGLPVGQHISPRLTTVFSPREEIGRIAAQQTIAKLEGETHVDAIYDVGYQLHIGEST